MNKRKELCLFTTAEEMKQSFQNPVIFLTQKDFAEDIIHSSIDMHTALLQKAPKQRILEIVSTFHNQWLQAVQDVENFKKRVKDTPRESIFKSIDFTMESAKKRHTHFQKYLEHAMPTLANQEKDLLQSDIEIFEDMGEILNSTLNDKLKCLQNTADKSEFLVHVAIEADELLNWLDAMYDFLAKEFCEVLDLKVPLSSNLTKTLRQVVDEVACFSTNEAKRKAQELDRKNKTLSSIARIPTSWHDVEIVKIIEKIHCLEDRITRMKRESSSIGIMALQHKVIFLGDRLESLENLKLSLSCLRHRGSVTEDIDDTLTVTENCHDIFDHLLPPQERCRLMEKLFQNWQAALGVTDYNSLMTIRSTPDLNEIYSDNLGHYTVDHYGRKLYRVSSDQGMYQLNEKCSLVTVNDDEKHVFFYDEIGRYYLTSDKKRVYKARGAASEYMLHRTGMMIKISEIDNGVEFRYDNLGRYYIGEDGSHVYREKGSSDEYQADGFGQLVKIRSANADYEDSLCCPIEPMVVEESKYLKDTIGEALKTCLAEIVLVQPEDPIKYLAGMLVKYRFNMEAKQKRLIADEMLMSERQRVAEENRSRSSVCTTTPPLFPSNFEEESSEDLNLYRYHSEII